MPATMAAKTVFRTEAGRALFAGLAGHSVLPLDMFSSAAIGWVLGAAAHRVGWPIPRGGSQCIANALASYFRSLGGEIVTGTTVRSLDELRVTRIVCDVTPRQFLKLAGDRLPAGFRRQLEAYRDGLVCSFKWTGPSGSDPLDRTRMPSGEHRPRRRDARRDRHLRASRLGRPHL